LKNPRDGPEDGGGNRLGLCFTHTHNQKSKRNSGGYAGGDDGHLHDPGTTRIHLGKPEERYATLEAARKKRVTKEKTRGNNKKKRSAGRDPLNLGQQNKFIKNGNKEKRTCKCETKGQDTPGKGQAANAASLTKSSTVKNKNQTTNGTIKKYHPVQGDL